MDPNKRNGRPKRSAALPARVQEHLGRSLDRGLLEHHPDKKAPCPRNFSTCQVEEYTAKKLLSLCKYTITGDYIK